MNRRNFVIGLGALSAGGAATVGSGAFSTADVNRDVTIETAEDDAALLALRPEDDDFAESDADGNLALSFTENTEGGEGVAPDSTYNFPDVFSIENQGTTDIQIQQTEFGGGGDDEVVIVISLQEEPTLFGDPNPPAADGVDFPAPGQPATSESPQPIGDPIEPGDEETASVWVSVGEDVDFGEEEIVAELVAIRDT